MLCITKKRGCFVCARGVLIFCNVKALTTFFHGKLGHAQTRMAKFVTLRVIELPTEGGA